MERRHRPTLRRSTRLSIETLEDRVNPAGLVDPFAAPITIVDTPGDRINLVTSTLSESESTLATLRAAPYTEDVRYIGFGSYTVTMNSGIEDSQAISYYSSLPTVTSVEPDYTIQVNVTPNDSLYSSLYGMSKISAPTAWDSTTGSGDFIVAVIDTGVDYNHPDLAANMWRNPAEVNGDGIDNDGNGIIDDYYGANFIGSTNSGNPFDDNGHGTHVAGTIGAIGNNSIGVAGVNWNVKIMALKFLNAQGSGSLSDAVEALNYAVSQGVKVSNNSWGGGGYSSTMFNALQAAQNAGHIFVAAAGNSNVNIDTSPSYPASYNVANVVAVASTTSTDARSSFSNYGVNTVDIAAPGSGIVSTTPNNTYSNYSGTSMATPHVAGAIALYWDANPTATAAEVIARLKETGDTVSGLTSVVQGGKRLNVGELIGTNVPPPPPPPPPPADLTGARVTAAAFSGSSSSNLNTLRVTFSEAISASSFTLADVTSFTGPNGPLTVSSITPVAGSSTQFDLAFATQTAGGAYTLTFGPGILDLAGNPMDQNENGTNNEVPGDQFTATRTLTVSSTQTFSAPGLPLAIRDFTFTRAGLSIDQDITIADINVNFTISHTYDSDLIIRLYAPDGSSSLLVNRRGGSANNFINTTIDDEAGTAISRGRAPFTGSFRPETSLSTFDSKNARGIWILEVYDNGRRDTGTLNSFSLIVTGTVGGQSMQSFGFIDGEAFRDPGINAAAFLSAFTSEPTLALSTLQSESLPEEIEDVMAPIDVGTDVAPAAAQVIAFMITERTSSPVIVEFDELS